MVILPPPPAGPSNLDLPDITTVSPLTFDTDDQPFKDSLSRRDPASSILHTGGVAYNNIEVHAASIPFIQFYSQEKTLMYRSRNNPPGSNPTRHLPYRHLLDLSGISGEVASLGRWLELTRQFLRDGSAEVRTFPARLEIRGDVNKLFRVLTAMHVLVTAIRRPEADYLCSYQTEHWL